MRIKPPMACLLLLPSIALASDPTALFVLFVEIPLLFFSLVFLGICFASAKVGRALAVFLLILTFPFLLWASSVGYMDSAGGMLLISIAVNVANIIFSTKKIWDATDTRSESD